MMYGIARIAKIPRMLGMFGIARGILRIIGLSRSPRMVEIARMNRVLVMAEIPWIAGVGKIAGMAEVGR